MPRRFRRGRKPAAAFHVLAIGLSFVAALAGGRAMAQAAVEVVTSEEQAIPELSSAGRRYKSWSLFLICSPTWALPESQGRILDLYDQFQAFGMAIGPEHAAVWFRASPGDSKKALVDVTRGAAFCSSLGLPPSQSPYLLVTTEYPGGGLIDRYPETFPSTLPTLALVSLNGKDAAQITRLIEQLSDQLVTNRVSVLDPQQDNWWRALERSYEGIRSGVVSGFEGVTLKIKTPFLDFEKKL